jgi:two-component system LytT family response regulator
MLSSRATSSTSLPRRAFTSGDACRCGSEPRTAPTLAPDLVLLDTDLAGLSGSELVARFGRSQGRPLVVLVISANDRNAANATAPVLAAPPESSPSVPVAGAVHRARGWASAGSAVFPLDASEPAPARPARPDSHAGRYDTGIWVTGRRGSTRLCLDTVLCFAADRDYVRIRTEAAEHLIRLSMHSLIERLDPTRFLRVHRSAIVNTDQVQGFERCANGGLKLVLSDGSQVPIARSYARSVKAALLSSQPSSRARRDAHAGGPSLD